MAVALLLVTAVVGHAVEPLAAAPSEDAAPTGRIPAADYAWIPDAGAPVLDPTGARIAWVAGTDPGVDVDVCVAPVADPFSCDAVGTARGRTLVDWIDADTLLVVSADEWRAVGTGGATGRGALAAHEGAFTLGDGRVQLTRFDRARWTIRSVLPDGSDPRVEGAGRGDRGAWLRAPSDPVPRGYFEVRSDPGRRVVWRAGPSQPPRAVASSWASSEPDGGARWVAASYLLDHGGALVLDGRDYDRDALVRIDLSSGERTLVYEPPQGVASYVLQDPTDGAPLAVGVRFERTRWHALDPSLQPDLDWLMEHLPGDFNISRTSTDLREWMLYTWSGTGAHYELFDRTKHTLTRAPPRWGASEEAAWRPTEAFVVDGFDGFEIPAYLTTPNPDRWGPGPYPLLVWVHGGPWSQGNRFRFDDLAQIYADLGWAYLAVDFRGSAGYGKAFREASRHEMGAAMQRDVYAAIDAVVGRGIADSKHLAWLGASYGGYSTLQAAVTDPTHITCGVSWDGPPRWLLGLGLGVARENLPATHPADVHVPLLVFQGTRDFRVPTRGVRRFADRAVEAGAPVSMIEFPGEKHQYGEDADMEAFELAEAFLGTCVGLPFDTFPADHPGVPLVVRHDEAGLPRLPPSDR